jgi:hypothetical protein
LRGKYRRFSMLAVEMMDAPAALACPADMFGLSPTGTLAGALTDAEAKAMGESLARQQTASWDLAAALKPLDKDSRAKVIAYYLAAGGSSFTLERAQSELDRWSINPTWAAIWGVAATASFAVSVYHGYKRNNGSLGWALGWGALALFFPVVTPVIAIAQGLGKPKAA